MESDWGNEILLSHRKKNRLCSHTRKKKEQSSRVNVVKSSQEEKKKKKKQVQCRTNENPGEVKPNPQKNRERKKKRKHKKEQFYRPQLSIRISIQNACFATFRSDITSVVPTHQSLQLDHVDHECMMVIQWQDRSCQ